MEAYLDFNLKSSHLVNQSDSIVPLILGVTINPPTLILIYEIPNPNEGKSKRRKRKMPIRNFKAKSDVGKFIFMLIQRHAKFLSSIPQIKLEKMLRVIQRTMLGLNIRDAVKAVEEEFKIDENEDLNKVTPEVLQRNKEIMSESFVKNLLRPGDPGYNYDKEVEFDRIKSGPNDWDEEFSYEDNKKSEKKQNSERESLLPVKVERMEKGDTVEHEASKDVQRLENIDFAAEKPCMEPVEKEFHLINQSENLEKIHLSEAQAITAEVDAMNSKKNFWLEFNSVKEDEGKNLESGVISSDDENDFDFSNVNFNFDKDISEISNNSSMKLENETRKTLTTSNVQKDNFLISNTTSNPNNIAKELIVEESEFDSICKMAVTVSRESHNFQVLEEEYLIQHNNSNKKYEVIHEEEEEDRLETHISEVSLQEDFESEEVEELPSSSPNEDEIKINLKKERIEHEESGTKTELDPYMERDLAEYFNKKDDEASIGSSESFESEQEGISAKSLSKAYDFKLEEKNNKSEEQNVSETGGATTIEDDDDFWKI